LPASRLVHIGVKKNASIVEAIVSSVFGDICDLAEIETDEPDDAP
jgi:hypothetical protein